jgi:hypothetical protein
VYVHGLDSACSSKSGDCAGNAEAGGDLAQRGLFCEVDEEIVEFVGKQVIDLAQRGETKSVKVCRIPLLFALCSSYARPRSLLGPQAKETKADAEEQGEEQGEGLAFGAGLFSLVVFYLFLFLFFKDHTWVFLGGGKHGDEGEPFERREAKSKGRALLLRAWSRPIGLLFALFPFPFLCCLFLPEEGERLGIHL